MHQRRANPELTDRCYDQPKGAIVHYAGRVGRENPGTKIAGMGSGHSILI